LARASHAFALGRISPVERAVEFCSLAECFDPCAFEQGLPDYRRRLYCYRAHELDVIKEPVLPLQIIGSVLILAGVWFISIASEEIESRV